MAVKVTGILASGGILIAAVIAFLAFSGTRVPSDRDFFGFAAACARSAPARDVVVSPGEVVLGDGETLSGIDFGVKADGLDYEIGIALSGFGGGIVRLEPDMSLDLEPPFDLSGPGTWPVVVVVDVGDGVSSEQGRLDIVEFFYSEGPIKYRSEPEFEFYILDDCGTGFPEKWLELSR